MQTGYMDLDLTEGLPDDPNTLTPFTSPVFFGCEDCGDLVIRVHRQLDECFSHTSGLQQPNHPESAAHALECEAADAKGWEHVREMARSIVIAIGVPEILKPTGASPDPEDLRSEVDEKLRSLEESRDRLILHAQSVIDELERTRPQRL
jgi:hypothetical protein